MKKLMIASVVAVSALMSAKAIESSNIVGYTTTTVATSGQQQMVGANFVSVGGEALDLQDIVLANDNANGGSWIKWWDPATKTYSDKAVYVDVLVDPETDDDLDYGGWGDAINWYPVTKTFAPGEGFWFGVSKSDVGITTAGQVEQPSTEFVGRKVASAGQQIMVLNPFPMNISIADIVLDNDNANGGSWIKWWDPATKTYSDKAVYVDVLVDPETDDDLDYGGWGDAINWYPVSKTFAAGEGFWFGVSKADVTISFANPFFKK